MAGAAAGPITPPVQQVKLTGAAGALTLDPAAASNPAELAATAPASIALTSPPYGPPALDRHSRPSVFDKKFLLLGALVFGLTAADVELTQHCLHAGTCYEMNPTLPRSRWGQYAMNTATNTAVMYFAYRRRASGKWGWWIAPLVDIGAHAGGIGSNIRFAW
jgi:hypothetical protein